MKLVFYCTQETVPMHYYEAMQVFSHIYGLPRLVSGGEGSLFVNSYDAEHGLSGNTDAVLLREDTDGSAAYYPLAVNEARRTAAKSCALLRGDPSLINDRNVLKRQLYIILSEIYGYASPWGVLTGVRPTKVVHKLIEKGFSEAQAAAHLRDFYLCSERKISLCMDTFRNQRSMLGYSGGECGLYISFPFCPSICSYCTFGSSPIGRYKNKVGLYSDLLQRELELSAALIKGKYRVRYIYAGGGTPTAVPPEILSAVLQKAAELFDDGSLEEFCVEAGRPDTIDAEKLQIIKDCGARRISINPQSMNKKTLELVGRNHSPEDIVEKFALARSMGFGNINMDVIAGLPGETPEDLEETMRRVIGLGPEGITVHTLSLKRASRLSKNDSEKALIDIENAGRMADSAREMTKQAGYEPFYMYRQKNCVGNNENVSYCRKGFESPYNVHIMDEDLTIIGAGAGAVTKIVSDGGLSIKRFFNAKSPDEYMRSFDVVLERKREALEA